MTLSKGTIKELLKSQSFVLYGQPKWTFGKNTCNTYEVFAETVLTLDQGSVHASEILPMIESDEELTQLFSTWFWEAALAMARELWDRTGSRLHLSMNVLPFQANLPEFYERIARGIDQSGLPYDHFQLELSEAQQLTQRGIENLNLVHDELGVKLLLGNFGTGYSNVNLLKFVHFDGIELDKSFSRGIPESEIAQKVVVGISQLADVLDLQVCAKGIETAEQLNFYEGLGFSKGQGYLFGQPMPMDELADYIKRYAKVD